MSVLRCSTADQSFARNTTGGRACGRFTAFLHSAAKLQAPPRSKLRRGNGGVRAAATAVDVAEAAWSSKEVRLQKQIERTLARRPLPFHFLHLRADARFIQLFDCTAFAPLVDHRYTAGANAAALHERRGPLPCAQRWRNLSMCSLRSCRFSASAFTVLRQGSVKPDVADVGRHANEGCQGIAEVKGHVIAYPKLSKGVWKI